MPIKLLAQDPHDAVQRMNAPPSDHHSAFMRDDSLHARALRMAMHAVLDGLSPDEAAMRHGLLAEELRLALSGLGRSAALASRPARARVRTERRKLTPEQEASLHARILASLPDELGGSSKLWSREAVRWLVHRETGLHLPDRTLSTYLERWGFAPEKPMRAMAKLHPGRMRAWLKSDYPVVAMIARESNGIVGWWGCAPLLPRKHGKQDRAAQHGSVPNRLWEPDRFSVVFVTTNRGHARWRVFEGALRTGTVTDLLECFVAEDERKLFLILPADPLFTTPEFISWAMSMKERISFHLFNGGGEARGPAHR